MKTRRQFRWFFEDEKVTAKINNNQYFITDEDGEGLVFVDKEAKTQTQVLSPEEFSTFCLTISGKRRKVRKVICEYLGDISIEIKEKKPKEGKKPMVLPGPFKYFKRNGKIYIVGMHEGRRIYYVSCVSGNYRFTHNFHKAKAYYAPADAILNHLNQGIPNKMGVRYRITIA